MDTLSRMFKRILILLGAAAMGFAACVGSMRLAASWSLFPNRDLNRSSEYVRDVLKTVNENYVDPAAAGYDTLARLSMHGMVDSLDPHSEYLESKDNRELEEDLDGEYGGIGIEVEMHKGAFCVVEPIPGSPGYRLEPRPFGSLSVAGASVGTVRRRASPPPARRAKLLAGQVRCTGAAGRLP